MVLTKVIKTTKMKESESQLNMHFKNDKREKFFNFPLHAARDSYRPTAGPYIIPAGTKQ